MAQNIFKGLGVALITPFNTDGSVDYQSLKRLVEFQIDNGADFLCILATTGEAPCLTQEEKDKITELVKDVNKGRIKILKYCGGNNTAAVVEEIKNSDWSGIDGILSICPYYNKPSQEGLYQHFKAVAEAVDIPVILYNVPGRTVADLSNDTVLRLAQIPNIVGIKDATGGFDRACDLIARAPKDFAIYSGDDASAVALMLMGGKGNVSVVANIAPRLMHEMCVAALAGDLAKARELHFRMLGLHRQLFCEANPIPVKWACAQMGLTEAGIRLPLTALSKECHERVLGAMRQAGLSV